MEGLEGDIGAKKKEQFWSEAEMDKWEWVWRHE